VLVCHHSAAHGVCACTPREASVVERPPAAQGRRKAAVAGGRSTRACRPCPSLPPCTSSCRPLGCQAARLAAASERPSSSGTSVAAGNRSPRLPAARAAAAQGEQTLALVLVGALVVQQCVQLVRPGLRHHQDRHHTCRPCVCVQARRPAASTRRWQPRRQRRPGQQRRGWWGWQRRRRRPGRQQRRQRRPAAEPAGGVVLGGLGRACGSRPRVSLQSGARAGELRVAVRASATHCAQAECGSPAAGLPLQTPAAGGGVRALVDKPSVWAG
jgi:hypothetical protein